VILVHDHRDFRVRFNGGQDQVTQIGLAGIFAGAGGALHDHRGVALGGGFHDRLNLFQVVDVERRQAVTVLSSVIQQLTHRN